MLETLSQFNLFDLIVGSIVLILAVKGFFNGVVREVFGLAGLIGGVYFASRYASQAAHLIAQHIYPIENVALGKLIGFMSVLILVWGGITLLGVLFSKMTRISGLGFVDRLLGFIAGGGKYFIIFALIVTALSNVALIRENVKPYVKNSFLYPLLLETGKNIIAIDPADIGLIPERNDSNTSDEAQRS